MLRKRDRRAGLCTVPAGVLNAAAEAACGLEGRWARTEPGCTAPSRLMWVSGWSSLKGVLASDVSAAAPDGRVPGSQVALQPQGERV